VPPRPREHIARLTPYEWEAMASDVAAAAGISEAEVVRFDTNTTPWPPVAWEQTVLDIPRLSANEYPHPSNEPLRSGLAGHVGVPPEQVVVTCGADEALHLIASVYVGPGRRAVVADPSFSMFRVATETSGGRLLQVAVNAEWDLPKEPLLEAVTRPRVGVVWLCSPNNPTGRLIEPGLMEEVAQAAPDALVCVDEAYYEIAGQSVLPAALQHPNVAVIRTFSKGYGLAGARAGYVIGQREITQALEKVRPPQNMTTFSIAAACRALGDQDGLAARVESIRAERARLEGELARRGWRVVPSVANFLLASPPQPALSVAKWLQGAGLIVRSYPAHPRLRDWLRITVRSPEEDDRLLDRLTKLP
jgi:histidinol-phosphate aminotransferase